MWMRVRWIAYTPGKTRAVFQRIFKLYIDSIECIDCGACLPVCPVWAIFKLDDDDLPTKWKEYAEKNARYYGR